MRKTKTSGFDNPLCICFKVWLQWKADAAAQSFKHDYFSGCYFRIYNRIRKTFNICCKTEGTAGFSNLTGNETAAGNVSK